MPVQINTTKAIHPLAQKWRSVQKDLNEKKWLIVAATGWSPRTFHNKINQGTKGKLKLKPAEIAAISQVLQIEESEILNYQNK